MAKIPDETKMSRRLFSSGSPFENMAGYSRAVVDGDMCFVAGTTGYDYATMDMAEDVGDQTLNILATISAVLEEAGFSMSDIVRSNIVITDTAYAETVFAILGRTFRDIRPAATMVVAGLVRPEMKIEIEVTAKREKLDAGQA